jgi:hypothetical protein
MDPLELTRIWEKCTWGAGYIGDAIKKRKGPTEPIRADLAEAEALIGKAHLEIKQLLSNRDLQ